MPLQAHGELIPQGGGDPIPLFRERMVVGRRDSCDICLRFPNISGKHCELAFESGFWTVTDLNSTNGIKVNGRRCQEKPVRPGDKITIGRRDYLIQYTLTPEGEQALEDKIGEGESNFMSQSLMERAGLEVPRRRRDLDDEDDA